MSKLLALLVVLILVSSCGMLGNKEKDISKPQLCQFQYCQEYATCLFQLETGNECYCNNHGGYMWVNVYCKKYGFKMSDWYADEVHPTENVKK